MNGRLNRLFEWMVGWLIEKTDSHNMEVKCCFGVRSTFTSCH